MKSSGFNTFLDNDKLFFIVKAFFPSHFSYRGQTLLLKLICRKLRNLKFHSLTINVVWGIYGITFLSRTSKYTSLYFLIEFPIPISNYIWTSKIYILIILDRVSRSYWSHLITELKWLYIAYVTLIIKTCYSFLIFTSHPFTITHSSIHLCNPYKHYQFFYPPFTSSYLIPWWSTQIQWQLYFNLISFIFTHSVVVSKNSWTCQQTAVHGYVHCENFQAGFHDLLEVVRCLLSDNAVFTL